MAVDIYYVFYDSVGDNVSVSVIKAGTGDDELLVYVIILENYEGVTILDILVLLIFSIFFFELAIFVAVLFFSEGI